jgi:hypothetical protein
MKCFVIMPFGDPEKDPEEARKLENIYSQWIKPTIEGIELPENPSEIIHCHRADKEPRPGEIITHVIENLVGADIVVADLSRKNPNVFYELGVRHTVANNTILIADSIDDIPFDLRGLRAISYKYDPEGMLRFKKDLENAVRSIITGPQKIDNPVRRFLYTREVEKIVAQPSLPGYDIVRTILSEMANLRKDFRNQLSGVRELMEAITAPSPSKDRIAERPEVDLSFFEGVWKTSTGSTYCPRIIGDDLYIPYTYLQDRWLTGHYFNCRVINRTLFAQFEWFHEPIWGYVFLTVESQKKLVGGWWYGRDVPKEIQIDVSRIDVSLPGMTEISLERKEGESAPGWAEEYFEYLKRGKVGSYHSG